ncbi:hypothetical protein ABT246_24525 [Streptomyces sp. NPDC001553]|uniref:hypothetical protein n=1 Tax=Streptomyces sp. NPDC001553 TaxID=3154385 RepID=UPI0033259E41
MTTRIQRPAPARLRGIRRERHYGGSLGVAIWACSRTLYRAPYLNPAGRVVPALRTEAYELPAAVADAAPAPAADPGPAARGGDTPADGKPKRVKGGKRKTGKGMKASG